MGWLLAFFAAQGLSIAPFCESQGKERLIFCRKNLYHIDIKGK